MRVVSHLRNDHLKVVRSHRGMDSRFGRGGERLNIIVSYVLSKWNDYTLTLLTKKGNKRVYRRERKGVVERVARHLKRKSKKTAERTGQGRGDGGRGPTVIKKLRSEGEKVAPSRVAKSGSKKGDGRGRRQLGGKSKGLQARTPGPKCEINGWREYKVKSRRSPSKGEKKQGEVQGTKTGVPWRALDPKENK